MNLRRGTLGLTCLLAFMLLAAGNYLGGAAQNKAPAWEQKQTIALKGAKVTLSAPILVARSRGYLWFPTLIRRPQGDLLAAMSNYADVHTQTSTGTFCWSSNGGLTWSEPQSGFYSDSHLHLPGGALLLLPYYLFPRPQEALGAPYQFCDKNQQTIKRMEAEVLTTNWPRPDKSFDLKLGLAGFVFNGQTVPLKSGEYLATLYGHFKDSKRYSLVAAASTDGVKWKIRTAIAGADCPLKGAEGPCEAALCRLADGRLMCVFRLASNVPYGQTFSADEGLTWTEPAAMDGPFSVQPSLAVLKDGTVCLSGGRPGLFLWVNLDGSGKQWQKVDLQSHHNACRPQETIAKANNTSAYTEVVALDDKHLLCIYDRIPRGWSPIPKDSAETNSVWVVRITLEKTE